MKLKPTPTSPKVRDKDKLIKEISAPEKKFDRPKKSRNGLTLLVVAILFGFLAGFLGEITVSSLAVRYPDSPILGTIYLRMYSSPAELIIRREAKNLSAQELQTDSLIADSAKSVVSIFEKKDKSVQGVLAKAYLDSERLGNGLIVTNDGLVMTTTNVISNKTGDYLVARHDGSLFEPEDIVIDQANHTVFFWIDSQSNTVADFESSDVVPRSAYGYVMLNSVIGEIRVANPQIEQLSSVAYGSPAGLVESSEEYNRFVVLSQLLETAYEGAPVVRSNGKIIGLVYSENYPEPTKMVLPSGYATSKMTEVIKDKKINRPQLGVHYVDLSRVLGLPSELTAGKKEGILLVSDLESNKPAIKAKSPAQGKLLEGDVILSVNNQTISRDTYFTELIQSHEAKQEITLGIVREDIEKTVTVKLEEL